MIFFLPIQIYTTGISLIPFEIHFLVRINSKALMLPASANIKRYVDIAFP